MSTMDSTAYTAGLGRLRELRDEIKAVQKELGKLVADRDRTVREVGGYAKARADRIAPAAGVSVGDVVALVPALGGTTPSAAADAPTLRPEPVAPPAPAPVGALAPDLTRPQAAPSPVAHPSGPVGAVATVPDAAASDTPPPTAVDPASVPAAPEVSVPSGQAVVERLLPSIPAGVNGDQWAAVTPNLLSTRPKFAQQARNMAFLDTTTGVLVHRDQTVRLDLGKCSAAEILTAVYATVPGTVERIYITAGDPWHRDQARYPFLRDAVAAWLNADVPGWKVESSRGKDRLAGHLVHHRNPVGRWQRGDQHTEIRNVEEWFKPEGADPAIVRDAFVLLWKQLHMKWPDVVLMGSPSQTGRDLWSRTIPTKAGSKWVDGYPVMSEEIRGLLHATAGQGRTELFQPPQIPTILSRMVELDRTFAYAKHLWASGVGAPRRITAALFASWSLKEQANALYAPSHWQVRVTVPQDWNHVGILPAPAPGERAWYYPNTPGQTFITWAGGAEINLALRNPISPWHVEILDGLLWESGTPLKEWGNRLKDAWSSLRALSEIHADPRQRHAAHLASRAVRSILLYGVGGFAQRPRITTGSTLIGQESQVPAGAQIIGVDDERITWQRNAGFSRDPFAHPEWSAGVWSGARAALLSTRMPEDDVSVGALHLPPGSVVAFRTDAIYTTADVAWPYHGQPGDYLMKGRLPGPITPASTEEEFFALQSAGRLEYAPIQAQAGTGVAQ